MTFSGRGLHSGKDVRLSLCPAPEDHGFVFRRIDLSPPVDIAADIDLVVEVARGTTLEFQGVRVATVEHLLSALVGMQVDNCLIELDGAEIPILDGSAKLFIEYIEEAGIVSQKAERRYFVLDETIHFRDEEKDVEISAVPFDKYSITVMIDYNSEVIGKQFAELRDLSEFKEHFASSRTFCFLHEIEPLLAAGLIKGGDLSNAIVIAEEALPEEKLAELAEIFNQSLSGAKREGIVNHVDLRYNNEPARHKLMDVIGDLALVGMPIKARIIASRTGHASNVAFGKKLKKFIKEKNRLQEVPSYDPNEQPVHDLNAISKILPHRSPFLLVDKVIEISHDHIVGVKNVTYNEPFFVGHFPGDQVMPGVLQIEAMAQTGGILVLSFVDDPENYSTYFLKIDNCKFKHPVVPGDTMLIKMTMTQPIRRGICQMKGAIYVGNNVVTEAELVAKIFKSSKD